MTMLDSLATETPTDAAVLRAVERAIAELRRGEPVLLYDTDGPAALILAAEQAGDETLARLDALSEGGIHLVLTGRRGHALGLGQTSNDPETGGPETGGVVAIEVSDLRAHAIVELADPTGGPRAPLGALTLGAVPQTLGAGAVDLAKLARLLPAALLVIRELGGEAPRSWAAAHDVPALATSEIGEYRFAGARTLARVAEARLPLDGAENTRVIAFRPGDGGLEHLALVIGEPRHDDSVLVRLHSECFTGDLLGSLRCDCGDQLRGAIAAIHEAGRGVLLYLSQEGRGIGLVNKLRAYQLQDRGADTAEANEQLGFDADERIYLPAASMLRQLGFDRVRLLTNNPDKVAALARCGITVEERVPHAFPSNAHNDFYLATKAHRFGHQF
ncbi:MAG: GTP cyclohydrolase II [Kiloniellales bacterium]